MDIFKQVEDLIDELRTITNYIDMHENKANLCKESLYPLRIYEISKSFDNIKTDLETKNKWGLPNDLGKIRNIATNLAVETDELHNSIMNEFEVEIKKNNDRVKFLLEHI